VKGSARVVFKLIVSAESDARPQEEGARMGVGDKGARGKMGGLLNPTFRVPTHEVTDRRHVMNA